MTLTTDVLVIGGGIVGASSAYHLARRGASVILLEAERLAFGATGRNLGYIWLHTRRAGPELALVAPTRDSLPSLEEELGADFGVRMQGGLIYFSTEAQAVVMREFAERRNADGVPVQLLDGAEARSMAPILSEDVIGATYCRLDAQVDSAAYVRAFAAAATRAGARIVEGASARAIRHDGRRVTTVLTDLGPIDAGQVVIAAGAWSPFLVAQLGLEVPIESMRLQIVQTEPMAPKLGPVLYGPAAIKQYAIFRELSTYSPEPFQTELEDRLGLALLESACQKADGSYLLGIAMDFPGFDWKPDLAGVSLVAEGMAAAIPEFRAARFARAWAGVLPLTSDSLPVIDRLPGFDDVILAAGHVFGNGAGPTTGQLVSDIACGIQPLVDLAPYRFARPTLTAVGAGGTW